MLSRRTRSVRQRAPPAWASPRCPSSGLHRRRMWPEQEPAGQSAQHQEQQAVGEWVRERKRQETERWRQQCSEMQKRRRQKREQGKTRQWKQQETVGRAVFGRLLGLLD